MAGKIHTGLRGGFDPAAHLEKQGWKGKGTALKHGHAVRPLATVQKKTLSGIGKDRDLAVPFWDQIFASTAASLSLPGSESSSPAPSPVPLVASSTTHQSTLSWQTLAPHGFPVSAPPKPKIAGLSTQVRIGRETAKRGLYGRFYPGEVLKHEEVEEVDVEEMVAGPSASTSPAPELKEGEGLEKVKKSKKAKKEKSSAKESEGGVKRKRRREKAVELLDGVASAKDKSSRKRLKDKAGGQEDDNGTALSSKGEETKEERRARRKEKNRLKEAAADIAAKSLVV